MMKLLKLMLLLLAVMFTIVGIQSCNNECENLLCQNDGICESGTCICPDGFLGNSCETFDASQVQMLLDIGKTPKELYDNGVPLDSLYGKTYEGGLIFYLNTSNGFGLVAATQDQATRNQNKQVRWGCPNTDIINLNNVMDTPSDLETVVGARIGDGMLNTNAILAGCDEEDIAAKLCAELILNGKDDWFLPSRGELNLMFKNLADPDGDGMVHDSNNLGEFTYKIYWSSTEYFYTDAAWGQIFLGTVGNQANDWKDKGFGVRAARAF